VYVQGAFIMNDSANVSGNNAGNGGGVCVGNSGTFTMNSGTISNNTATLSYYTHYGGGGVYVNYGTFNMLGGTIGGGNTAVLGGGVHVSFGGIFTMNGTAVVSGNTGSNYGGGVLLSQADSIFNMEGGTIGSTNNAYDGGGVYVLMGNFTMTGGEILGNHAAREGGGVCVRIDGIFHIVTGTVYGSNGESLKNTVDSPGIGAALTSNPNKAQYGNPPLIPWTDIPRTGSSTFDREETIEVVNGVIKFTDTTSFKSWLDAQSPNTAATAYPVKLNVGNLGGAYNTTGSVGNAIYANRTDGKYVNLDLSGSNFTTIGASAFAQCNNLAGITLPEGVISIDNYAFYNCSSLVSVTLPESVTTIGNNVFYGCSNLVSINIPGKVTAIGSDTFTSCTALTDVTISAGVTTIGSQAFSSCSSLASITIPASVTSIGSSAFFFCNNLTSVTFETGSAIEYADFASGAFPEGSGGTGGNELRTAYQTGGAGTYMRDPGGTVWTKQP